MQSHEALYCQRVNTPLSTKNLDATKVVPRPPSRALYKDDSECGDDGEFCGPTRLSIKRDGFFSGNASSINSRLIYLADIGRCDLYGRSATRIEDDYKIPERGLETWFTLSSEDFKKKQRARLASNEPRLIELAVAPDFHEIVAGRVPIPFNISIEELIKRLVEVDGLSYVRYSINRLMTCHGLITDAFWWIFLDKFFTSTKSRNEFSADEVKACQEQLIYCIAEKFVALILDGENKGKKDEGFVGNCHVQFFNQLAKLLALVVYSAFCHAWKDSWRRFVDPMFRQYLIDQLSLWVEGIKHVPGEGDDDHLWKRVEPFMLRKDRSTSESNNKNDKSRVKTVASHLNNILGVESTPVNERHKWKRGMARLTILNKIGGQAMSPAEMDKMMEKRMSRRRETVSSKRMSIKVEDRAHMMLNHEKTMAFDSSKFDVNGCSPLFELVFPSSKSQMLVSRRNCLSKQHWKSNPLEKSYQHMKEARNCMRRAKKFNSNIH